MSVAELKIIEERALHLSTKEREELANHLFQSVHHKEMTQIDHAWIDEAEKRFNAFIKDKTLGIRAEKIYESIESELKW